MAIEADRAAQPSDTTAADLERELHYVRSHLAATQEVERKHANTIADLFERLSAAEALLPAAPPPGLVPVAEVVRWLRASVEAWERIEGDREAHPKTVAATLKDHVDGLLDGSWLADLAALDSTTKETTDGK